MIRVAEARDVDRIVDMGARNYAAMPNVGTYDPAAAREVVERLMAYGEAAVFVSDGGMIGGVLDRYWAAPDDVRAVELFWFAEDGSGAALLRAFEDWARERGAGEVRLSSRPSRGLERRGYDPVEAIYRRRL